jgi:hypothetical protein
MILERKKRKIERKQKSEHPKNASLFSLLFLNFSSSLLELLILFSVRVRYLLYNKRTRLFGAIYYDYCTLLLLHY